MLGSHRKAEQGVIQSSISLLQERFKQLQRVKEMREKRELVRIFSSSSDLTNTTTTTTTNTTDSTLLFAPNNYYHHNDNDNDNDDKLQVFLPPNYYNYSSCYQSSPSSSSSSSSSHNNNNNNNCYHQNQDEVSLSLWPSMSCNMNNSIHNFGPTNINLEAARPVRMLKTSDEEYSHVSDVDTTLHL